MTDAGKGLALFDALRAEHVLIEQVVGSLRTFLSARRRGEGKADDAHKLVAFFELFAGTFHHAREEHELFDALVQECELPRDRGPIAVIGTDHSQMAATFAELAPLLTQDLTGALGAHADALAKTYSHALWHHIDAENSVLFSEGEERLRRAGVHELSGRPPTAAELDAKGHGEALLLLYPPFDDPTIIRGDGCVMCPAFGETCKGLEREWWGEWEWDEHDRRRDGE